MKNKTLDFTNWLDDMAWNFDNDFLDVNKSKVDELIKED
tara:strand:- start:811 stop:927 length:117 start_codon:yes stop_codon:yes gene_type:complete